eukprot:TRINITY_DN1681_c3_g1_i1.p1 TRINITY_DN1681_c3_g1~~TRINITY_DN1681_c3_g1_i1.p1  ORF type:complete len:481 (+),score=65.48 TRINITY_DN1681_c3_g1_i1:217-1659(+)
MNRIAQFLFVVVILVSLSLAVRAEPPGYASSFGGPLGGFLYQPVLGQEVEEDVIDIEGETEGEVVIERVVAYPNFNSTDEITLRNIGGQTVDLTGWILMDSKETDQYVFGKEGCEDQAILEPGFALILYPYSEQEPCGFDFGVSFRDEINLFNVTGELVSNVSWAQTSKGSALYRTAEDQYITIAEGTETVIGVLSSIPDFSHFLTALKEHDLYDLLKSPSDPENLEPFVPQSPEPNYFEFIEFPWWFGYARNRSEYPEPDPVPTPPEVVPGVPELGPYTLLVPTNKAFEDMRTVMTGSDRAPMNFLLKLPEMRDILEYHIIGGGYTSAYMFNNTPIITTQGQDVLIIRDPVQIEGNIGIMDTCVDKPTTGYGCAQQAEFGKCYEPFMISPLAAGWQGGFCQRSCQRCSCETEPCAKIQFADILATNGVIHAIDRLLFPPPTFDLEEEADEEDIEDVESELLSAPVKGLPELPKLPGLRN